MMRTILKLNTERVGNWSVFFASMLIILVLVLTNATPLRAEEASQAGKEQTNPRPRAELAENGLQEAQDLYKWGNIYFEAGDYAKARDLFERSLEINADNPAARVRLQEAMWFEREVALRRHSIILSEAENLMDSGEREKAFDLVKEIPVSNSDPIVLERIERLLSRGPSGFWSRTWDRLKPSWVIDLLFAVVLVVSLLMILLILRQLWTRWCRFRAGRTGKLRLRVAAVSDKTDLGVSNLIMSELARKCGETRIASPFSAGLLNLGVLPIESAVEILFSSQGASIELAEAAEGLQVKVGTLDLSGVLKFLFGLGQWFNAKLPFLVGIAFVKENGATQVGIRLTCTQANGDGFTVSAFASEGDKTDAATLAVEKVVFKMFYLLANRGLDEGTADSADSLREGLGLLRRYVEGESAENLSKALVRFSKARNELPALFEAYLYEGIVLDLMEKHDDAIRRFQHVEQNAKQDSAIRTKAIYNQAVAHLRKYRPEDLEKAVGLYKRVAASTTDELKDPSKLLAMVGVANAVAHYPIFWKSFLHPGTKANNEDEIVQWKDTDWVKIQDWVGEVDAICREVDGFLPRVDSTIRDSRKSKTGWDQLTRKQLVWGKLNAIGNVRLNVASGFMQPPLPLSLKHLNVDRQVLLEAALDSFKECEIVLSPGVETLTNIATTLMFLDRFKESREYAVRAIQLNPDYEYASFRLAHCWEREGRGDKAREILVEHKRTVTIPQFRALFEKYKVAFPE